MIEAATAPDTVALLLERAQDAIAFERERADGLQRELNAVADSLGTAVRSAVAGERKRIRELANRAGAACTGDEGTGRYFSALLEDPEAPDD